MRTWLLFSLSWACVSPKVAARLEALEERVATLEARNVAPAGVPQRPPAANPASEALAEELAVDAEEAAKDLRWPDVQALCARFAGELSGTRTAGRMNSRCTEWAVVGKKDAGLSDVRRWYVGSEPRPAPVTMLLFAEEWCPHCRRETPKVQELATQWAGRVQVVGLTKVNRSSTDESVTTWLTEAGVTFPFGKESGALSDHYAVKGVPAAAIVRDGVVVWRGHPARLDTATLEKLTR
jgi:thiol-disulfide isomerase/thioredoxin